jgi:hypothetical protein
MVSATDTRNYLLNDPILDWLKYHSSSVVRSKPEYAPYVAKAITPRGPAAASTNFTEFIMAKGIEFESRYLDLLYSKFERRHILDIRGGGGNARSKEKFQATIDAMNQGIPIIYSGVLHNTENRTFGVPDLLVRSDWINRLVTTPAISFEDSMVHAPFLIDPSTGRIPRYHYRVLDIKFTTLYLCSKGHEVLNSGSFPAYKGQLLIYNDALARVQGYDPQVTYLIGRKWTYTTKGETFRGKSCCDRLGIVDYRGRDKEYIEKTAAAIEWIRDMRLNGGSWDISTTPFTRKELYPNMSFQHDYPWRSVKEAIAKDIKEITDLWMCGPKNRVAAHANGIYGWDDERCWSTKIGVTGNATSVVLDKILKTNRDRSSQIVFPLTIENNDYGWQERQTLEFYVDFEYVNDIDCKFDKMPFTDSTASIFMIGVGYYDPMNKSSENDGPSSDGWNYRCFVAKDLSPAGEKEICQLFSDYVRQESEWHDCPNPLLIHWANAENWQWSHAVDKHNGIEKLWIDVERSVGVRYRDGVIGEDIITIDGTENKVEPRWFDLLTIFKKEPITVKGSLGFGLKSIAGALAEHNLIKTTWDASLSCADGAGAMLGAFNACSEAKRRRLSLADMPQIQDIKKYNEVDCKVLGEILVYLRENHTIQN